MEARAESDDGEDLRDEEIDAFILAYKQRIPPPNVIPKKQWILCAVGLVGAGKTTVIKPISDKLHLARISSDEIRILLRERGYNFKRTLDVVRVLVQKYITEGRPIAFDADSIAPENREELQQIARAISIPVLFIHIDPPEEFILNKLKHVVRYEPSGLIKDAEHALEDYFRRKPLHEKYVSEVSFNETFDTSRSDIGVQIDAFIKHLKQKGF